ncbi:TBCA-domain-containing protein [Microstroma glucosiphilum]|uniref:Tubulin-specific chaperone A n=1 Tax=Pseudomicrostroma glucosiphilum TaxID=1684307 RepID=A0A316UGV9_9BASI|nr:TBCA-domain-containing protein [Pseudomicrostroma glucosiphilum]PWN24164.1 TBCA-domain-containing protein [Pseudomicrostroma glucosiphilum]
MGDEVAIKRQLNIKTGVVKRLTKETGMYVKEAQEQQTKLDKATAEGQDEWDVKNQQRILQDCAQMIPDSQRRLEAAVEDLEIYLEGLDSDLVESEEAKGAQEAVKLAKASSSTDAAA